MKCHQDGGLAFLAILFLGIASYILHWMVSQ